MEIDKGANLMLTDGKAFADCRGGSHQAHHRPQEVATKSEIHPTAAFAFEHVSSKAMEESLFRLGEEVDSMESLADVKSAESTALLARPGCGQVSLRKSPESTTDFAVRSALNLDRSVARDPGPPAQARPTGAEMICAS
jgi:hypothetical protein